MQYLHQLGCISILPKLAHEVIVSFAVQKELQAGVALGLDLPDLSLLSWVKLKQPISFHSLPLASGLGHGESAVLALALESASPVVILDDGLGRQAAELLKIPLTGTLGILLDAKKKGIISTIEPLLNKLDSLRFRVSPKTRVAVLKMAGEV